LRVIFLGISPLLSLSNPLKMEYRIDLERLKQSMRRLGDKDITMDKPGYFGQWGGAYIPEVLYETFRELREVYAKAKADPAFWQEYLDLMGSYSCLFDPSRSQNYRDIHQLFTCQGRGS